MSVHSAPMKGDIDKDSASRATPPAIRQGSIPHGAVHLDDLDRRVLKLLRHDGRVPYAQIARTLGVSEPTARKRVDRLVQAGAVIIMGRLNPAPMGLPVDAFVGIRGPYWVDSASGKTFASYNPATGEVLTHCAEGDAEDINRAVTAARKAFESGPWKTMTASERGRIVWKIGDLMLDGLPEAFLSSPR